MLPNLSPSPIPNLYKVQSVYNNTIYTKYRVFTITLYTKYRVFMITM